MFVLEKFPICLEFFSFPHVLKLQYQNFDVLMDFVDFVIFPLHLFTTLAQFPLHKSIYPK